MAQIVNGYFVIETTIMDIIKKTIFDCTCFVRSLKSDHGYGMVEQKTMEKLQIQEYTS